MCRAPLWRWTVIEGWAKPTAVAGPTLAGGVRASRTPASDDQAMTTEPTNGWATKAFTAALVRA
jgi:hypothetical protein